MVLCQVQWQGPAQWPFWTPWAYHQTQGTVSRGSQSVASEGHAPPSARDHPTPWGSDTVSVRGAESGPAPAPTTGTEAAVVTESHGTKQDASREQEGHEGPVLPLA